MLQHALNAAHGVWRLGAAAPTGTMTLASRRHPHPHLLLSSRDNKTGSRHAASKGMRSGSRGSSSGSRGYGGGGGTRRIGGVGGGVKVVAEQHGIALEDAARMFSERFPLGGTSGMKLDLRDTACGRGLVATEAIAEGETLITVPWQGEREDVHSHAHAHTHITHITSHA